MTAPKKIGAFFDLDGTLLAPPSLEWRFIRYLVARNLIGAADGARWLGELAKWILVPGDLRGAIFGNKQYLAGLPETIVDEWEGTISPESLSLFEEGIDRVHWHLERRYRVVLVTGTLAPLARAVARHLPCQVEVRATELETSDGRFTGWLCGAHMSANEKARAVREEAAASGIDLSESFAYGNAASDREMLEAVGRAAAVNPSWRLRRLALKRGWATHCWNLQLEVKAGVRANGLAIRAAR
jgi:putative phosphoserine phosphatase/1-acylglycerol-3-phosphate O-acyltransferase